MKIAVISDSHDNVGNIKKAVKIANDKDCSYLLHLGDIVSPFSAKILAEFEQIVYAVFGNNDGEHQGLIKTFNQFGGTISSSPYKFQIDGKKFLIMHEPYLLDELINSQEFSYIFYGHLHEIDFREAGKTIVLNPGELGGWLAQASFYIFDTVSNEFEKILI